MIFTRFGTFATVSKASYIDAVVADGATAFWLLNETSGTSATDVISAKNLTYRNSPTLGVSGPNNSELNNAVQFNGTTQNAFQTFDDSGFASAAADSWSIEGWVNFTSTAASRFVHVIRRRNGAVDGLTCAIFVSGGNIGVITVNTGNFSTSVNASGFNDGDWHHVVGTAEAAGSGNMRLYIDGVERGNNNQLRNTTGSARSVTVGSNRTGSNAFAQFFPGSVAACAFYRNITLSAAQVTTHYNLGKA